MHSIFFLMTASKKVRLLALALDHKKLKKQLIWVNQQMLSKQCLPEFLGDWDWGKLKIASMGFLQCIQSSLVKTTDSHFWKKRNNSTQVS